MDQEPVGLVLAQVMGQHVDAGWKVQVVAKDTGNYPSITIDPNLEHAYVHFIDQHYDAENIPDLLELDFKDD